MLRITTVLALTILMCQMPAYGDGITDVRPITITVVDKVSKKPLRDVLVTYILQGYKYKKRVLFFFKRIEPDIKKINFIKRQAYTDESGRVIFDQPELRLSRNVLFGSGERLDAEKIFINAKLDQDHPWSKALAADMPKWDRIDLLAGITVGHPQDNQMLVAVDLRYHKAYIHSTLWPSNVDPRKLSSADTEVLWISEGLSKQREELTIALARADNQQ